MTTKLSWALCVSVIASPIIAFAFGSFADDAHRPGAAGNIAFVQETGAKPEEAAPDASFSTHRFVISLTGIRYVAYRKGESHIVVRLTRRWPRAVQPTGPERNDQPFRLAAHLDGRIGFYFLSIYRTVSAQEVTVVHRQVMPDRSSKDVN
ncbi:MAG: hypothetical protein AAGA08_21180 [Pseudomonadota bacterium]